MCPVITTSILLVLLFVCSHFILPTDGLPIIGQERGIEDDLIAGSDFLSVLMDLPALRGLETTTVHPKPSVTLPTSIELEHYSATLRPIVRESRSTHFTSSLRNPASDSAVLIPTQSLGEVSTLESQKPNLSNRRLVSVSISSSVAETHRIYSPRTSSTTETMKKMKISPNDNFESDFFSSEDDRSFVAEANRHEFSVDEPEPITKNADTSSIVEELPANVQAIPVIKKISDFEKTSELLKELSQEKLKDKLPPFHHTVIYHDDRNEQMAARSVSYSTVIQTVPEDVPGKKWRDPNRSEEAKPTQNSMSDYKSKDYDVSLEKSRAEPIWDSSETSTGEHAEPTEINWGMQQKPYMTKQNMPAAIYTQPEENYEVDEAVSVQTNGKSHGVQLGLSTEESLQKPTAKSKNGYVIEGRKERRYRVEERTPDGFIVGEFGIVNRDDGLLRGVRYTAEETINPKIIYDTLMKFLSL
ncbi:hypothetical protein Trydic_g9950 [Trypoxylus dichotomus]